MPDLRTLTPLPGEDDAEAVLARLCAPSSWVEELCLGAAFADLARVAGEAVARHALTVHDLAAARTDPPQE